MRPTLPPRVIGLAGGAGAVTAGLLFALFGALLGEAGLVPVGFVVAGMGLILLLVGAVGFALHGSVRAELARQTSENGAQDEIHATTVQATMQLKEK
jgi:hypothetical protein